VASTDSMYSASGRQETELSTDERQSDSRSTGQASTSVDNLPRTPNVRNKFDRGLTMKTVDIIREIETNDGLRRTLVAITGRPAEEHGREWEAIAVEVMDRADRDCQAPDRHYDEFVGAYALAALELLKVHPQRLLQARNPWGMLTTIGRRAGRNAVAQNMNCGLTARDERAHKVVPSAAPKVYSLDALCEETDFDLERELSMAG